MGRNRGETRPNWESLGLGPDLSQLLSKWRERPPLPIEGRELQVQEVSPDVFNIWHGGDRHWLVDQGSILACPHTADAEGNLRASGREDLIALLLKGSASATALVPKDFPTDWLHADTIESDARKMKNLRGIFVRDPYARGLVWARFHKSLGHWSCRIHEHRLDGREHLVMLRHSGFLLELAGSRPKVYTFILDGAHWIEEKSHERVDRPLGVLTFGAAFGFVLTTFRDRLLQSYAARDLDNINKLTS